MQPTPRQLYITATGTICGSLSVLGAGYVLYDIWKDKKKWNKPYFRLMCGMMFIEFFDGLSFSVLRVCLPKGTWVMALGNDQTCRFQGFFMQMAVGSSLYNAGLSLYYLLSIRYSWTERIFSKRIEPWIHTISMGFALGTAVAALALNLYKSLGPVCYIGRTPPDCKETYIHGYTDCEQGDNASLYSMLFFEAVLWLSISFTAICMVMVWSAVRNQENRSAQYTFQNNSSVMMTSSHASAAAASRTPNRKLSNRFAMQGLLYVVVFYFCHIFVSINIIQLHFTSEWINALLLMGPFTIPSEGFLNCLVYLRPRFLKYLRDKQLAKQNMQRKDDEKNGERNGIDYANNNNTNNNNNNNNEGEQHSRTNNNANNTNNNQLVDDGNTNNEGEQRNDHDSMINNNQDNEVENNNSNSSPNNIRSNGISYTSGSNRSRVSRQVVVSSLLSSSTEPSISEGEICMDHYSQIRSEEVEDALLNAY